MMATLMLNPIAMMVEFIVFCCCVAVVIILGRWLLSLTGLSIPQPLLVVLAIIAFIVLLMIFLNWTGIYDMNFGGLGHPGHSITVR
jgi:hypothetical protein